jgi:hypothetical protein
MENDDNRRITYAELLDLGGVYFQTKPFQASTAYFKLLETMLAAHLKLKEVHNRHGRWPFKGSW